MADGGTAGLTPNQRKALEALLQTTTVTQAAVVCGLSQRTLWRYLADDQFKMALRTRQDKTIQTVTASLVGLSGDAVRALHELLTDDDVPEATKARVGLGWLKLMRESVEIADLADRVARLEEAQQGETQ